MYEDGKMRPDKTILGMGGGRVKESDKDTSRKINFT
jgi:hypothetical protein